MVIDSKNCQEEEATGSQAKFPNENNRICSDIHANIPPCETQVGNSPESPKNRTESTVITKATQSWNKENCFFRSNTGNMVKDDIAQHSRGPGMGWDHLVCLCD